MKKTAVILPLFCLLASTVTANDWLSNFDITPKIESQKYSPKQLSFPSSSFEEASVDSYNDAVSYNNEAVNAMNEQDYEKAVSYFKEAVEKAPAVTGFRNNYIAALSNSGNYPDLLIEEATILLGMEPDNTKAAYIIGLTYLNKLKNYDKAADYFSFALNKEPDNANYANALITALENTGKYNDYTFELLKKYSKSIGEAYPYYLLGLKYLKINDYTNATKAFAIAKKHDEKGFSHHAYVRAAFYGGFINDLKEPARIAINKYGNDTNIASTKRIYKAISNQSYNLSEEIFLNIKLASSINDLCLNIRPIKSFAGHQEVSLISAELSARSNKHKADIIEKEDGSIQIKVPSSMLCPEIKLELKYHIAMQALCNAFFNDGMKPDISDYTNDQQLSLDDNRLSQLIDYIEKIELPDSNQAKAKSEDELFVKKAACAISKGLGYKENGIDQSVEWALDNLKICDCTEYSRLLAAVCIKKNIPARLVTGFLVKTENLNNPTKIGHEWCEIYINKKGWMPVDPTLQSTMHLAYYGNMLNDQIFFEYPSQNSNSRIGVTYTSSSPDVSVTLDNYYKVSDSNN